MRHKETHFVNIPQFANRIIELGVSLLSDKLKGRITVRHKATSSMFLSHLHQYNFYFSIQVHKSIDELKEKIKPEILPKEYGGTIPLDDIIKDFKLKLLQKRAAILSLDDMCIEINKDSNNTLVKGLKDIDGGLVGSFRKLEVD